ncbi:MAG: hypothetical protein U9R32_07155 [Bacteroidota bacterium]|nr:hypothetical protein [Bacteroidota bacterium]
MKENIKRILALAIILSVPIISEKLCTDTNQPSLGIMVMVIVIGTLFIFNYTVRNRPLFKPYFTSNLNILTAKYRNKTEYNISRELMLEKTIEVLKDSNLTIKHINKETYEILATSSINLRSWGEIVYIDFREKNEKTILNFCSTTFFGMISWGKNEKHYNQLINNIEESLVI